MKKGLIKAIYLIVIFIAALLMVSAVVNQGNTDMTMEMGSATLPVIHMQFNGRGINELHGYNQTVGINYQRDNITPLSEGRKTSFELEKYEQEIKSLSFEVRSADGERLVENTKIKKYTEEENTIQANITIKDLIEEGKEYMLVILVELEQGRTLRYYTRIIQAENYYAAEKIDFVLYFHEKTFQGDGAEEISKYLESNSQGDNTTYSKVTINSSFRQVTWGDLPVKKLTEPEVTIKELGEQTGSLELRYLVSITEGKEEKQYQIKEFYRIRYTADRIYLLDYERTMDQIFNEKNDVFSNNKIMLGITRSENISIMESDGGNVLAFTDGKRLFCYNSTDKKLARLFGFYEGKELDARELWPKHEIKILNVDEAGNVEFIVYGYMNRGRREGSLGIAVYHYNGLVNTIEEMIYIPSNTSYELLKAELSQLSYLNKSGVFFFIYHGGFYSASLESKSSELIVSELKEGSYQISDTNRMVVWQNGDDSYNSDKLVLMNLNTQQKTEISADEGERIAPLGFIGEDLIYGLAKEEDISTDTMGNIIFPMYRVLIQSENEEILKTYEDDNAFIISSEVTENQINFKRVAKNPEGPGYYEIDNYQIVNTKPDTGLSNTLEVVATENREKVVQIAAKATIEEKAVKQLTPKEVIFEGGREIILEDMDQIKSHYYVYGKGGIEGIFTNPGKAVNLAYTNSGTVVNDRGSCIWRRGNRKTKNQIMAIKESSVTESKNSLAICLDTMLAFEGIMRNTELMLADGNSVREILESGMEHVEVLDLTGCSLDAVLYYVNQDIPVLATLNDGTAVLVIGFNEMNTVLMDPVLGTIYKKGMNDSMTMFEENGNSFITYMKK